MIAAIWHRVTTNDGDSRHMIPVALDLSYQQLVFPLTSMTISLYTGTIVMNTKHAIHIRRESARALDSQSITIQHLLEMKNDFRKHLILY